MTQANPYLDFALSLAHAAGTEVMRHFSHALVTTKADGTEVTEADRSAERCMRSMIEDAYPDHGILGEEEGQSPSASAFQWVLDPLDGTTCFALGVPKFGTLVSLLEHGQPVLGVIYLPFTNETLYAQVTEGCWYTSRDRSPERVHVDASVAALSQAYVSLSGIDNSELRAGRQSPRSCVLRHLLGTAGRIEFVGDCTQYMLVARGKMHAAIDALMYPWDSAAPVVCIREAGGVVSTLDGTTDDIVFGGSLLASCSPALHEEILCVVAPQDSPEDRRGASACSIDGGHADEP